MLDEALPLKVLLPGSRWLLQEIWWKTFWLLFSDLRWTTPRKSFAAVAQRGIRLKTSSLRCVSAAGSLQASAGAGSGLAEGSVA